MILAKKWPFFVGIVLLFCIFIGKAHAVDLPKYACALKKPLIFGASISAGYLSPADAFFGDRANKKGLLYFGRNLDPVTVMAKALYQDDATITNISEIINVMPNKGYGYRQFQQLLKNDTATLTQATALASIDGLYWPSIHGACDEAIHGTAQIINFAKQHQQVLILGNVPEENPDKVLVLKSYWSPPEIECVEKINQFLEASCKPQQQCYVIDMHKVVAELNSTGIEYEGSLHTADNHGFRMDGVHLTPAGISYIIDLIDEALKDTLPFCAKN